MSDWKRSTKEIPFEGLPSEMIFATNQHIEGYNLGPILSAQLIHITVQDYAQTLLAKMVPDSGVEVSGIFTDASERVSAFIGLEENTAGNKFKEILIKAVQDAKK